MKENIEFYPHKVTADQHPKFSMLRVKYGWAGEGKFWALNNRIGQAENCLLDISKKYNKASIADFLGFKLEEFDEFILYLLKDCELIIQPEEGKVTTETIQETFKKVMADRESSRDRKKGKNPPKNDGSPGKDKSSPELPKSSPDPDNKLKKTIVNQTKVNQTKVNYQEPTSLTENFKLIESLCNTIDGFSSKEKFFNPRKWAANQLQIRGHPRAIFEALNGLSKNWNTVDKPYGYVRKIMNIQNGNFNEADAISIHKEMKNLNPGKLKELTSGLLEAI